MQWHIFMFFNTLTTTWAVHNQNWWAATLGACTVLYCHANLIRSK